MKLKDLIDTCTNVEFVEIVVVIGGKEINVGTKYYYTEIPHNLSLLYVDEWKFEGTGIQSTVTAKLVFTK